MLGRGDVDVAGMLGSAAVFLEREPGRAQHFDIDVFPPELLLSKGDDT
jgi:hypothetical protein